MDESTYVDQSSMVDNFFGDDEPLVWQDSGEPATNPKPGQEETNANNAKNETEESQPEQPTEAPAQQQVQQPVEQATNNQAVEPEKETVEDPFSFIDEKGEFNALSAVEFIENKKAAQEPQNSLSVEAPKVEEAKPVEPQSQENEITYDEAVRTNLSTGLDYIQEALNSGYTMEQAYVYAKQKVESQINEHLLNKRFEDQQKSFEEKLADKKAAVTREEEMMTLRPESTKNLHEVARAGGYGTVENFKNVLMNPAYGGDVINYMFSRDTKGQKFTSQDELGAAMNDWFIKFTADRQSLNFLQEVTRARITNQRMPEIVKAIRANQAKVEKSNSHAKSMAVPSVQNQNRTQPAAQGPSLESQLGLPEV